MPIDVVLNCDTGMEFPEMWHLDKLEAEIKSASASASRAFAPITLSSITFSSAGQTPPRHEFSAKFGKNHTGYGWASQDALVYNAAQDRHH